MKAVRVIAQLGGDVTIERLALPTVHRVGTASPTAYRQQAKGEQPKGNFAPQPADFVRAIKLSDGPFTGLGSQAGALLTFVISGDLTLSVTPSQQYELQPGDILLTDAESATRCVLDARNDARLVQINVPSDWPGHEAEVQRPGTYTKRPGAPKVKRIYTGEDDKAYFTDFEELFPDIFDQWSAPTPVLGFRMIGWDTGAMDFHPCVIGQLGIVSCGTLEVEVGGGGGAVETFRAGDISLSQDITGQGHIVRTPGYLHVTNIVIDPKNLWAFRR